MDQANSDIKRIKKQIKADPELRDMLVRSGRNEIMLDLDGDGAADLCISSEGSGGRIDTLALDLSGNGDFNLFLHDADGNGIPDTVFWADDDSDEAELIAFGSDVELGLLDIAARIDALMSAEEFLNDAFGVSLTALEDYLTRYAQGILGEIQGRMNAEGVEKVYYFLNDAGTYYLATQDGDQPRVRPFGTVLLRDGKLYIQTGKIKEVSAQIAKNPRVELCAFMDGAWLRVAGELVNDDDRDVKLAMLEKMPELKPMYSADDDNMQMLYFKDATATFSSFTGEPEVIHF